MKTLPILITAAAHCAALTPSVTASYHLWRGGDSNPYWSEDSNWSIGGAPAPGETGFVELGFGQGALAFNSSSDINNLHVDRLTIAGSTPYVIGSRTGGPITLKPQITGDSISSACPEALFYHPLILTRTHRVFSQSGTVLKLYNSNDGIGSFSFHGTGTTIIGGLAANYFTGTVTVQEGILKLNKEGGPATGGSLVIGQYGAAQGAYVYVERPGQIPDSSPVTVHSNSYLFASDDTEMIGPLTMTGGTVVGGNGGTGGTTHLVLGGPVAVPQTATESPALSGAISLGGLSREFDISEGEVLTVYADLASSSSEAGIIKTGGGTLVMRGDNVFGGITDVRNGRVILRNIQPNSDVAIRAGGEVTAFDADLGCVTCTGGVFRVTYLATAADGVKTKSVVLGNGSVFRTDVIGPANGKEYGQIEAHGSVTLNGCALEVVSSYDAGVGVTLRIIDNFGAGPVIGTFLNLPEGARFTAGSAVWQITYQGGAGGNDVVLTRKADPANLTSIVRQANDAMVVSGTGDSGRTYRKEVSTDLRTWTDIGPVTASGSGRVQFTDSEAGTIPRRFYRCPAQ